jgi:hypothetical protein
MRYFDEVFPHVDANGLSFFRCVAGLLCDGGLFAHTTANAEEGEGMRDLLEGDGRLPRAVKSNSIDGRPGYEHSMCIQ